MIRRRKNNCLFIAERIGASIESVGKDHLLKTGITSSFTVTNFREFAGKGTEGITNGQHLKIGACRFAAGYTNKKGASAEVWISMDDNVNGYFTIRNLYRSGLKELDE